MMRSANPILKISPIFFFGTIAFTNLASAETALTDQDRAGLVGEYQFSGDFKKTRGLDIRLVISQSDGGALIGEQTAKAASEPRLTSARYKFTNYRRLTAEEWESDWKIKTLSGASCDRDRHCYVADLEYTFTWNNSAEYTKYYKRLQQFTLDYSQVQNITVEKKGNAGSLSAPYRKVSVGQPALSQPAQKEQNKEQVEPVAGDTSELKGNF